MTPFLEDFIIYLMGLTFPFYLIKSLFCAYFSDIIWCFQRKKCTYEFEPEDVNKENMSIAEMSGKKLDWFRKVCAAVL